MPQIVPSSLTGNLWFLESSLPVNANPVPGAVSVDPKMVLFACEKVTGMEAL
ncbi:hypothetical protein OAP77_01430 [Planctomycetota bacterium]|nr:hypothetical protein [Planctomycetota bacterium]